MDTFEKGEGELWDGLTADHDLFKLRGLCCLVLLQRRKGRGHY